MPRTAHGRDRVSFSAMSASRPRSMVVPALFGGLLCGISAACSGILGLDELPLRPERDASPTAVPTDAATAPPVPDAALPEKDAAPDVDAAKPPCDPATLDVDPNNCGACGKVCKSSCAASVCDADRVGVFPGAPRGLFVAGASVFFATAEGARTRVASCPIAGAGACTPVVERTDMAEQVRLLAVRPSTPPLLTFFTYQVALERNAFYSCEAGACAGASPFRVEPGLLVADAIDIDVVGTDHWVAFTTSINGVIQSVGNLTPTRVHGPLSGAQLLGYNQKYLWARKPASIERVTLDTPTLPLTTLALTALPAPREVLWNGSGVTLIHSSNGSLYQCAGAMSDCAAPTSCLASPAAPFFGVDATHVAYGLGAGITVAGYDTPCTAAKAIAPAAPSLPSGGRSIALAPSHVFWLEAVGSETHLYRAPR